MIISSRWIARAASIAIAASALLSATPAAALLVQPIVIELHSTGTKTGGDITVTNDRREPVTVEITVNDLAVPESGDPVVTPETGDDFLIFPPQATIQPGHTQVIRIRWIGDPTIPESKLYMFATTELPIDKIAGTGVQIVYSIQSLVTVTNPATKSDLHVADVARDFGVVVEKPGQPGVKKPGLSLTFANEGNAVDLLSHYQLKLQVPGAHPWTKTIQPGEIVTSVGLGLVPPNGRRKLFVAVPDIPADGPITVTVERPSGR
jgi:P pilus assembly chaperone PapD